MYIYWCQLLYQSGYLSVIQRIFKKIILPSESWTTDGRVISTCSEYQLNVGSSLKNNSAKNLIATRQIAARAGFRNKAYNVSVFDRVGVRKNFVEIDGILCRKGWVKINYDTNDYTIQVRDIIFL